MCAVEPFKGYLFMLNTPAGASYRIRMATGKGANGVWFGWHNTV